MLINEMIQTEAPVTELHVQHFNQQCQTMSDPFSQREASSLQI